MSLAERMKHSLRDFFRRRIVRSRRRLFLYIAGIFIIAISGAIAISSSLFPLYTHVGNWSDAVLKIFIAFLGALMGILLMIAARQETRALDLFDWLQELNSLLASLSAPLNVDGIYPVCEKMLSVFSENAGWILLIRAPGLLIRGEVKRRKYLPIVSASLDSEWNVHWAENYLKDLIENVDGQQNKVTARVLKVARQPEGTWSADMADKSLIDQIESESQSGSTSWTKRKLLSRQNTDDAPVLVWTSKIKTGDISIGMAVGLGGKKSIPDKMTLQALTTSLDLLVQRIGSILTEVIQRREGLGIENLGLIMRVLAHEINNDLQGALNTMDTFSIPGTELPGDHFIKLRAMLARASHWSHLMREAPFLVDNVLPVERDIVSLSNYLRQTLDEIRQAWPDLSFVLRFPEDADPLDVVGDQHICSIVRNLLHNAASFSPEEGTVSIDVMVDDEYAHVSVHDEGPGVDPADVDRIFSPLASYKEGRKAGVRAEYGMGVGLTISRAISRAYGGDLLCYSNAQEVGGCFQVFFPLAYDE